MDSLITYLALSALKYLRPPKCFGARVELDNFERKYAHDLIFDSSLLLISIEHVCAAKYGGSAHQAHEFRI